MTRDEFYEIETWYELLEFCDEMDYDHDDVFTWDELCSWAEREIQERIQHAEWTEVRDFLNDLPEGDDYDVYIKGYDDDWQGSDDDDRDFRDYRDRVEEWCNDNELFDEDEEDEDWDEDDDGDAPEEPLRNRTENAEVAQPVQLDPEPITFNELFEGGAEIRSFVPREPEVVNAAPDEQPDEMPLPW